VRLLAASLLCFAACATVPKRAPADPVPLGAWCDDVGRHMCKSVGNRCFGGMSGFAQGCLESFQPNCLAGRDANAASGRTQSDLDRCLQHIDSLSCEGLGASVGSGALGEHCAVR
jgi:hypothetical protein